jgi:hypothetical protein
MKRILRYFYIWLFGDPWQKIDELSGYVGMVTNRVHRENIELHNLINSQKKVIAYYRKIGRIK